MKHSTKGFTLIETVVSMLIVVMLSLVIVTATRTALNVRSDEEYASESELLAATVNIALGDVLHFAQYSPGTQHSGDVPAFTNRGYGILKGHLLLKDGRFYINATDRDDNDADATLLSLVSKGTYTSSTITDFTMHYDEDTQLFTGTYTIRGSRPQQIKEVTFAFRTLNEAEKQADAAEN